MCVICLFVHVLVPLSRHLRAFIVAAGSPKFQASIEAEMAEEEARTHNNNSNSDKSESGGAE